MHPPADSRPRLASSPVSRIWVSPLLVVALALLVTSVLLMSVTRSVPERDREAFEGEVTRTTDAIRERIDTTFTLLHATAGLFVASREVERDEFARYIAQLRLRESYPGILGLGFTERLQPGEVRRREAELRSQGQPQFRVWPDYLRDEYHAIVYIEPLDARNRAALGYDMSTEPTRRAAMEKARDEGRATASGKVTLVQEIDADKQAGFVLYQPIYRGAVVPATVEDRREALLGYAYAPLRVGDMLRGVRGSGVRQVDFALYDGPEATPQALMLSSRSAGGPNPAFRTDRAFDVAGRTWLLRFSSRPAFEALSQRRVLPWLAGAALAATLLLGWIAFAQARGRRVAEEAAAQRRLNELALQASEERERERAQRLEQLYAQGREAERRKDEFLAVLAHELRNPLAPIRTPLEVLRRAPDGPAAQRAREIAERQVRHMVRLIDDLLDVSRISRGKIALQRERTRLADVVGSAVETSRPVIDARRHALHVAPVDGELHLDIDPARVAQILTNLLNNAAHYTPEGGRIDLTVQVREPEVRISVRDNGIGIPPEKLDEVFQLFVQVERSPAGGGLGIGLSLAARLAELHGGRIEAHSEGAGRGAEFVLVLPCGAGAPPAAPPPAQSSADAANYCTLAPRQEV